MACFLLDRSTGCLVRDRQGDGSLGKEDKINYSLR